MSALPCMRELRFRGGRLVNTCGVRRYQSVGNCLMADSPPIETSAGGGADIPVGQDVHVPLQAVDKREARAYVPN